MNKQLFNRFVIGALVVSNLVLLFFFLQKPSKHFDPDRPRNIIIKRLQFDDNQVASYDKLIDQHRIIIREKNDQMVDLKRVLYEMLPSDALDTVKVDSITAAIGDLQTDIEAIHFHHFQDIKSLCTPGQLEDFNQLSLEFQAIFNAQKRPGKRFK